jgi:hypothetical protein
MTIATELQAGRQIFHEHGSRAARMWLVATQTSEGPLDLGWICGIMDVGDGMSCDRMSHSIFQIETHDLLLGEVILREPDLAPEEGQHVSTFHFFMRRGRAVTLRANRIPIGTQQLRALAAMRLVTSCATLLERRLVQNPLVLLIRLIHMAVQTNVD